MIRHIDVEVGEYNALLAYTKLLEEVRILNEINIRQEVELNSYHIKIDKIKNIVKDANGVLSNKFAINKLKKELWT